MMGYKKFYLVLSLFLCVCSLYAQDRLQRAVKEIKDGSVNTHVIPMVGDVWGEIDGWVKSPYKTVYPHSWSKNKAVLSDGDSFIHLSVVRMSSKAQRDEANATFSSIDAHRGIVSSQGGEYVTSTFFTTSEGYPVVRITMKKRKERDVAYMDIYFVRASRNSLITSSSAVASNDEKVLEERYKGYRQVFDYMINAIKKR